MLRPEPPVVIPVARFGLAQWPEHPVESLIVYPSVESPMYLVSQLIFSKTMISLTSKFWLSWSLVVFRKGLRDLQLCNRFHQLIQVISLTKIILTSQQQHSLHFVNRISIKQWYLSCPNSGFADIGIILKKHRARQLCNRFIRFILIVSHSNISLKLQQHIIIDIIRCFTWFFCASIKTTHKSIKLAITCEFVIHRIKVNYMNIHPTFTPST